MKRRVVFTSINVLLMASLAACSGSVQLEIPTAAVKQEIQPEKPKQPEIEDPAPTGPKQGQEANDNPDLMTLQNAYIEIYKKVIPSVVSIQATKTITGSAFEMPQMPFEFFDNFDFDNFDFDNFDFDEFDFGIPKDDEPFEYQEPAAGSGFVWDTDGHIVTNNHVVAGTDDIRVVFADERSVAAELVGADAASDLAVLKVDVPAGELIPVTLGDSTKVQVGQIAVAIGNPFRLEGSMTTGIVSGLGRSIPAGSYDSGSLPYSIPDLIQTDAAINPGNSGGVLVDINGELIGITTAIESPVRANAGIGYVIPSVIVQKIVPFLIKDGKFEQPWIGIAIQTMNPETAEIMGLDEQQRGALVTSVRADSPAEKAELQGSTYEVNEETGVEELIKGGDLIIMIDDYPVNDNEDLIAYLARYTFVGETITLSLIREHEEIEVDIDLAARPEAEEAEEIVEEPEETVGGAWLGIFGVDVDESIAEAMELPANTAGILIEKVTAGSPADAAGLRGSYKPVEVDGVEVLIGGDVITAVDLTEISSMETLADILRNSEPDTTMTFTILRDGEEQIIEITLGEQPE